MNSNFTPLSRARAWRTFIKLLVLRASICMATTSIVVPPLLALLMC